MEIKWICWNLIWKIREITVDKFFLAGFSHLKPLCVSSASNNLTKFSEHHLDKTKQEFLDSHLSDLKKNDAFVTVINVSSVESEKFVKSADATQPTVPAVAKGQLISEYLFDF